MLACRVLRHCRQGVTRHRAASAAVLLSLAVMAACLLTGFVTVHGWGDWSAGTDASYCGVYWPHLDFYCESAS